MMSPRPPPPALPRGHASHGAHVPDGGYSAQSDMYAGNQLPPLINPSDGQGPLPFTHSEQRRLSHITTHGFPHQHPHQQQQQHHHHQQPQYHHNQSRRVPSTIPTHQSYPPAPIQHQPPSPSGSSIYNAPYNRPPGTAPRMEYSPAASGHENSSRGYSPQSTGTSPGPTRYMMPSPAPTAQGQPEPRPSAEPQHHYSQYYQQHMPAVVSTPTVDPMAGRSARNDYSLIVRQQPKHARACGFGERDRRVIDPPPIVQLVLNDSSNGEGNPSDIRYMFNVVHCTLWSEDRSTDETAIEGPDKRYTRRLMGTLVSSPFVGQDENGKEGCFFCFPDLSCRTHGKYRLRFVLMHLEPSDLRPDGYTPILTEVFSDVFTVFSAKEFPGMTTSTELTKALKRQGCAISVKKGNDKKDGAGSDGKEEEDDESPGPNQGRNTKRRRKN